MNKDAFTQALQKLTLPVTVVTVGRGGAENALTVSWVCPASFDPPRILFAADSHHYSVDFLKSTKNFAVNILREGQQRFAGHFARQSMMHEDKLQAMQHREATTGGHELLRQQCPGPGRSFERPTPRLEPLREPQQSALIRSFVLATAARCSCSLPMTSP